MISNDLRKIRFLCIKPQYILSNTLETQEGDEEHPFTWTC